MEVNRILHVIAQMDPQLGGVAQAVRTLIEGLSGLKIQNEVISLDEPDAAFIQLDKFPLHALGPSKSPWSFSPKLIPWLLENFSRFDVIIHHGLWLYPSYALQKAIEQYRSEQKQSAVPKVFIMPHGMLDPYFQKASGRKLKALRNSIYYKIIEGNVVNKADGLLFTCEEERRLAHVPFSPYNPKQELVVGLGVEEPPVFTRTMSLAFQEKCAGIQNRPYILFISRIHEKKGIDLLIEAYAEIAGKSTLNQNDSSPDSNMVLPKLIIAGPGLDTPYGAHIQKIASETEVLRSSIIFPGMLTGDAKWGAFYGCEAFILPSHQENFGIAVVEAMACGKPVLISNQVNIWREINDSGGGMVSDNTVEGTTALLTRWMLLTREDKQTMGKLARDCYNKNFAIEPAANRFLAALVN